MKRQLDDYYSKFYCKQAERFAKLAADDNKLAKEIASWKETVAERWDAIHVVSAEKPEDLRNGMITSGQKYTIKIVIDEAGLQDAIGLELVTLATDSEGQDHIYSVEEFKVTGHEGNNYTFELEHKLKNAGGFKVAYRMFPKNENLPHRQDFCYVKWFN